MGSAHMNDVVADVQKQESKNFKHEGHEAHEDEIGNPT
jgi:hypothetical protein